MRIGSAALLLLPIDLSFLTLYLEWSLMLWSHVRLFLISALLSAAGRCVAGSGGGVRLERDGGNVHGRRNDRPGEDPVLRPGDWGRIRGTGWVPWWADSLVLKSYSLSRMSHTCRNPISWRWKSFINMKHKFKVDLVCSLQKSINPRLTLLSWLIMCQVISLHYLLIQVTFCCYIYLLYLVLLIHLPVSTVIKSIKTFDSPQDPLSKKLQEKMQKDTRVTWLNRGFLSVDIDAKTRLSQVNSRWHLTPLSSDRSRDGRRNLTVIGVNI